MPLTATADYQTSIGGRQVTMVVQATVTLPGSGLLDLTGALTDVSLSCAMATPMPAGVRAPSGDTTLNGTITISGTVVVSGQTMTVADLFDRSNTASPLYRLSARDCKITYAYGPRIRGQAVAELKTQADGWVSDYTLDRQAGSVAFTVTDVPPTWDQTPAIPPVITDPPYNAGMTSEFAMDHLIRLMDGVSSWPALRPNCVLAVGFRSSIWAEVGALQTADQVPVFCNGAFGSAICTNLTNTYTLASTVGTTVFHQFWTTNLTGVSGSQATSAIGFVQAGTGSIDFNTLLNVTNTTTTVTVQGTAVQFPIALDSGPHCIEAAVTLPPVGGTAGSGTVWVDGVAHPFTVTGSIARLPDVTSVAAFAVGGGATFEAWQITTETAPTPTGTSFYPHFVCDTSLNPLTAVPAIDKGTAPWDVLETIAGAECGLIQRIPDPNDPTGGQLRFTNRRTLLGYNPARGRTITSLDSLKAYTDHTPPSAAIRTIEVPYSEWDFGKAGLIWSAAARKKIKANSTVTWKQVLPAGALAATIDTTVSLLPTTGYPSSGGGSYYLASIDAAGTAAHPGLTITLTLLSPDTVLISVQNSQAQDAWLSVPGTYTGPLDVGSPALWIGGIPATVGQEALATAHVGSGLGVLSVPSNPYIQDHDTALTLAQFLLNQLSTDVDDFPGVALIPDGTILCGDMEHVTDQYGHLDDWMVVWAWTHQASWQPGQPATFDMTVDLHPLGPPGAWLIGFPGRSEIGQTTYVYAVS
jgi:hypothetical protein